MIRRGQLVGKRLLPDNGKTNQTSGKVQRMGSGENVKERAVQRGRQVDTRLHELTPGQDLSNKETQPEQPANAQPLPDSAPLILANSSLRELDRNAAREQHHRIRPHEARERDVLPLGKTVQQN